MAFLVHQDSTVKKNSIEKFQQNIKIYRESFKEKRRSVVLEKHGLQNQNESKMKIFLALLQYQNSNTDLKFIVLLLQYSSKSK